MIDCPAIENKAVIPFFAPRSSPSSVDRSNPARYTRSTAEIQPIALSIPITVAPTLKRNFRNVN